MSERAARSHDICAVLFKFFHAHCNDELALISSGKLFSIATPKAALFKATLIEKIKDYPSYLTFREIASRILRC
jgi:hypothetical protein